MNSRGSPPSGSAPVRWSYSVLDRDSHGRTISAGSLELPRRRHTPPELYLGAVGMNAQLKYSRPGGRLAPAPVDPGSNERDAPRRPARL